jgi:hypothetical protein
MPNRKKPEEKPKIPLDIASYKLYYVNYKIGLLSPLLRRPSKPESGWLFPPSAYCPHDCEFCPTPCKLSRYHVGPHTCGKRHGLRSQHNSTFRDFFFRFLFMTFSGAPYSNWRESGAFFRSCCPVAEIQPLQGAKYV